MRTGRHQHAKRPEIAHAGIRACYSPSEDAVSMPEAKLFESSGRIMALVP